MKKRKVKYFELTLEALDFIDKLHGKGKKAEIVGLLHAPTNEDPRWSVSYVPKEKDATLTRKDTPSEQE